MNMYRESLPSVITCANLAAGILSLALSWHDMVYQAAYLILLAVVCDGLDGKLARRMHLSSTFGAELDSLADLVSFCVAPAFLYYTMGMAAIGAVGDLGLVAMVLAGAIRLARFNVSGAKGYFVGLPTTAAGGIAAGIAVVSTWLRLSLHPAVLLATLLVLAFLMVSRIKVPKI